MRRVLWILALLVLLPEALAAQLRRTAPGHRLTLVVSDVSDRPCTGLEVPAPGVTVELSGRRVDETRVTGRNGRAVFTVPSGRYDLVFTKGAWTETVENYPVTMDRTAAVGIPQRTEASTWDLHVRLETRSRAREGDRLPVTVRVRWIDPDEQHYAPPATVVLERSFRSSLRGRRSRAETVATWEVGPLCGSTSDALVYEETDLSAGSYTYRARLETSDGNRRNNVARAEVHVSPPPQPDLALSVEQSHATIPPGETMTYTVRVSNPGTGPASGVVVRTHVSENLDFVSASGSHGLTCAPGATNALGRVVVCSGGQVGARQTAEIEIRASVPETAQPGHTIQFVARADPDDAIDESDEGNNHEVVQATSGSPPPADLAVSIEQSQDVVPAGKSVRYRVSIANAGNATASDVRVRNLMSQNLDFVYARGNRGFTCSTAGTSAAGLAVECTGGGVEPGRSALIEIVGELSAIANPGHELRFVAWADPDDAIEESDEGNNHRTVLATTGEPVLVEYVIEGYRFAREAHQAGWSSYANKVEGSLTSACNLDEQGFADFNNVGLPNPRELVCDYMYFSAESRRLAEPWTLVSVDVSFNPRIGPRERAWLSSPQTGSDDISFSFRLRSHGHFPATGASIDRITLRGPEGRDWKDALE